MSKYYGHVSVMYFHCKYHMSHALRKMFTVSIYQMQQQRKAIQPGYLRFSTLLANSAEDKLTIFSLVFPKNWL